MNLSLTLDVAISLIFVYVLAAVLASMVNEMIAGWLQLRGVYLTKAIEEMTSLGTDNPFGWGGLWAWARAVWQGKPAVSADVDNAALAVQRAAEHAASLVGATAASVAVEVRNVANFNLLVGLDDTIDDAIAAGATAETLLNVLRSIGGIATLQLHPLLVRPPNGLPSYVPARDFAAALLGLLQDGSANPAFEQAKAMIGKLPNGDLKTTLLAFINAGASDIDKLRTRIEDWFDDAMERLSGIYKRFNQYVMLFLGLVIAVGMNVDSVHMAKTLWDQPALSEAIAGGAAQYVKENQGKIFGCKDTPAPAGATGAASGKTTTTEANSCKQNVKQNVVTAIRDVTGQQNLPIGRATNADAFGCVKGIGPVKDCTKRPYQVWTMFGWVITAFAISLGAQFWFGLLTQLTSLRAAGDKPQRANATPSTS